MPNAECRAIPSIWGHIAGGPGLREAANGEWKCLRAPEVRGTRPSDRRHRRLSVRRGVADRTEGWFWSLVTDEEPSESGTARRNYISDET
jgi:hypothetical protein